MRAITYSFDMPFKWILAGTFYAPNSWKHAHRTNDNFELIIVIKGQLHLRFNQQEIVLHPNSWIVIPPNTPFEGSELSMPGLSFYWLHFTTPNFEQHNYTTYAHKTDILLPAYYENIDLTRVNSLFQLMLSSLSYPQIESTLLNNYVYIIIKELSLVAMNTAANNEIHSIITYVEIWLKEHLHQPITLNETAKYFGYNPAYLSHLFVKATGLTLKQKLTELRIERAKEYLRASPYQITEIARLTGYTDAKYFTKVFKQQTSLTPSTYRKLFKNNH